MSYPVGTLAAIANETRAQILQRLEGGEKTVGELAEGLPVSRPAISQHLRVLEQAKLVTEEYRGTRHVYRLDLNGFAGIRSWVDRFWTNALASFAAEVERQKQEPRPSPQPESHRAQSSHAKRRPSSRPESH
jgi:DNA-binding transcriptional ArsR family regulator